MKPHLASKTDCTGCMACVDSCKFSALTGHWADDGHLYVVCDENKCTNCGKCEKICPIVSAFSYERKNSISTPYAAWANDDTIRMRSASGGIFAAVADYIIRNGGYVVGAIMDGVTVKYVITDKLEDIANMQGSKYQQADSTGIYKLVKEKISAGSVVFFSGVPCQVAGLYSLLGKLGHSDLLLTADLVCTGFPTSLLLKRFMDNINYPYSKISYRNKSKGWINSDGRFVTVNALALTVTNRPGEIIDYGRNNFVYNGYFCGHTLRYSCSNCRFPFLNRKADLTLADFWGEKHFPEEHYKGISCVVAHSDAGRKLLTAADITFHEVEWADFIPFNKMVYSKMPYLKIHPARRLLAWNFSHLSFTCLEKIYGGKIKKTNIVWLPYKIFNFIIWKISEKRRKIYNKNFLKKIRNEE